MKDESVKKLSDQISVDSKKEMKNFLNDPYFVKKADESKAFLDKAGFPKELLKKL